MRSTFSCASSARAAGFHVARLVGGVLDVSVADIEGLVEVDLFDQAWRHLDVEACQRLGQGVDVGPVLLGLI